MKRIKEILGDIVWHLRYVLILLVILSFNLCSVYVNHKIHQAGQHNKVIHEIVMQLDFMDFMVAGGGAFGYANYYKYHYAKWRQDPKRTWIQKVMFWDKGFMYDASNPPEEYQYPFLGEK